MIKKVRYWLLLMNDFRDSLFAKFLRVKNLSHTYEGHLSKGHGLGETFPL